MRSASIFFELPHGMHVVAPGDPLPELAPHPVEQCERCGHPMPEGCIGWCSSCSKWTDQAMADFYSWGGWRRAFGEHTDAEWAARAPCRFEVKA